MISFLSCSRGDISLHVKKEQENRHSKPQEKVFASDHTNKTSGTTSSHGNT